MSTVLCVDDDPLCRKLMVLIIQAAGHRADAAGSVDDALARIASARPDLVVLDLEMTPKDGVECLKSIRGDTKTAGVPVILVSSRPTRDVVLRVARLGVQGVVLKGPTMAEVLGQKIVSVLSSAVGQGVDGGAKGSAGGSRALKERTSVTDGRSPARGRRKLRPIRFLYAMMWSRMSRTRLC